MTTIHKLTHTLTALTNIDFSLPEINVLRTSLRIRQFKSNEVIQATGDVSKSIYFVTQGKAKSIYENAKGQTFIWMLYFNDKNALFENMFINDYSSFLLQQKSPLAFVVIEDLECVEISFTFWSQTLSNNSRFERLGRIIAERAYLAAHQRAFSLLSKTAKDRYTELISSQPYLLNTFNHYDVANYLGIATQSLSRIKNDIFIKRKK